MQDWCPPKTDGDRTTLFLNPSLVFSDVLPEHRTGLVAIGDLERRRPQSRVLGDTGLRRSRLPEDRGGVLGDLDELRGYQGIEPEEVAEHLFEFFVLVHV